MWYLVVDEYSNRYFIKETNEESNKYYILQENDNKVEIISIGQMKSKGYRIVGEAFSNERHKLEVVLNGNINHKGAN